MSSDPHELYEDAAEAPPPSSTVSEVESREPSVGPVRSGQRAERRGGAPVSRQLRRKEKGKGVPHRMVASVPSLLQGERPVEEGRAMTETPPPVPIPPPVPTPVRPPLTSIEGPSYRSQVGAKIAARLFGRQEEEEDDTAERIIREARAMWEAGRSSGEEDHPSYIDDGKFAIKEHEDMSSLGDDLW